MRPWNPEHAEMFSLEPNRNTVKIRLITDHETPTDPLACTFHIKLTNLQITK